MPELSTPEEIRLQLSDDSARLTEAQLLTLVVGSGRTRRQGKHGPKRSWTAKELAADLVAGAGGRWASLVRRGLAGAIRWERYSIGSSLAAPVLATMHLAARWRPGFDGGGDGRIPEESRSALGDAVLEGRFQPSEGESIALLLGRSGIEKAAQLLGALGSPQELVRSLAPESFVGALRDGRRVLRLREARWAEPVAVELSPVVGYRLLAAVELVRRTPGQAAWLGRERPRSGKGVLDLGRLFDDSRPIDAEQRLRLLEVLRSHPLLAETFAALEELRRDAGVESLQEAAELQRMLEALCCQQGWRHPSEVLGLRVPYGRLLAVVDARLARGEQKPANLAAVQERLRAAEAQAGEGPAQAFVKALREQRLSPTGLEIVLAAARDLYLAPAAGGPESAGARR